jgi:hypothetical protein
MLGQLGRCAATGPERLEYAVTELEAPIERGEERFTCGRDATVDPDVAGSARGGGR